MQIIQRFHLLAAVGFKIQSVRVYFISLWNKNTPLTCSQVSRTWCLLLALRMSMCENFCLPSVASLHITTNLFARHPPLCGALLQFEILQIRPAIVAIHSA